MILSLLVLAGCQAVPVAVTTQGFKPDYHVGYNAWLIDDFATALRHFTPLAEQGDAKAQVNLGLMHLNGHGVTKDLRKTVRWFRIAAKQGNARAQVNLAWMYRDGKGILQDLVMAYVWLNVAEANGLDTNEYRDSALARLTAAERKLGQRLSLRCFNEPRQCPEYSEH